MKVKTKSYKSVSIFRNPKLRVFLNCLLLTIIEEMDSCTYTLLAVLIFCSLLHITILGNASFDSNDPNKTLVFQLEKKAGVLGGE